MLGQGARIVLSTGLAITLMIGASSRADDNTQGAKRPGNGNDMAAAASFFQQIAAESSNPYIAAIARENAARLSVTNSPTQRIRHDIPVFSQPDNSVAVPAMVNGKTMGTFIIDTGASYTVITPRMARKLGVEISPETPTVSLITGNGMIQAPVVTLHNVMIGQVQVAEVQAVVQDLGKDLMVSGLLGMNFFKGKTITLQQDHLILEENAESPKLSSR